MVQKQEKTEKKQRNNFEDGRAWGALEEHVVGDQRREGNVGLGYVEDTDNRKNIKDESSHRG